MDFERVQQAGVALFSRKGFAATGIRELGAEAGINSATLYHYVGSKELLLASIIRACLEEMTEAGQRALKRSADPAVQLAGLVAAHVGLTAVNRLTARVAEYEMRGLTGTNQDEMQKLRDDYEAFFGHVLERGGRVGVFHVDDLAMSRLAVLEMCTGVAHWYRPDGRLTLPEIQDYFVRAAFRLVSADYEALDGADFMETSTRLGSEPVLDDLWAKN